MSLGAKWIQCPSFLPPPGLSKEADSPRAPRSRTTFTEEQVSTLESSFQHNRYLDPQERLRLAQTMGLSEVQVRPLGSASQVRLVEGWGGGSALFGHS